MLTLVACSQEEKLWDAVKVTACVLGASLLLFTALESSAW